MCLVGDVFSRMLMKAADHGLIKGLMIDFREEGTISLQYADDTIIFSNVENQQLKNLKFCLVWFKCVLGMRINFHKSEIVPFNLEQVDSSDVWLSCSRSTHQVSEGSFTS